MRLFKDKSALVLDKLDVKVIGRNSEVEYLQKLLSGISDGYFPKAVNVFGPPGSGKTFVIRKVFCDFAENSGDKLSKLARFNCHFY